jgi:isopentenyl-diphosphate delta-isomerase
MTIQSSDDDAVILVDDRDNPLGTASKLDAHRGDGLLHRAFSVFVFDSARRLLIQKRSAAKYHFAGVWANTCCSHPRPGESVEEAAHRRLREEMGFDCALVKRFSFVYRAVSPNGMVEHELDHVLTGTFPGVVVPNPNEVQEWEWVAPSLLFRDTVERPDKFAPWFRLALPRLVEDMHLI